MAFLHYKHIHLGSVSFAFFHANIHNGFSLFMQPKLSSKVNLRCLGCSLGFLGVWLGYHLNFQNLFVRTNTSLISVLY
jgi:hypothetical protein